MTPICEMKNSPVSFYGLNSLSITSTTLTTGTHFSIIAGGGATTIQAFNTHTITVRFTHPGYTATLYDTLNVSHNAGANLTSYLMGEAL